MICVRCGGTGKIESFLLGKEIDCARCNGKGYIGQQTNFERITSNPEALADFITELANTCAKEFSCEDCPMGDYCACDNTSDNALAWLKQESDT